MHYLLNGTNPLDGSPLPSVEWVQSGEISQLCAVEGIGSLVVPASTIHVWVATFRLSLHGTAWRTTPKESWRGLGYTRCVTAICWELRRLELWRG